MLNRQREMTYCALFNNTVCIDALEVTVLSSPASLSISERSCFPKENNRDCYLQKFPATLRLEDKWMVYDFNCLLTPSSVRI